MHIQRSPKFQLLPWYNESLDPHYAVYHHSAGWLFWQCKWYS